MNILVFGSNGLVGSSLVKNLQKNDDINVIGSSRKDTDLFNLEETKEIIKKIQPNVIVNAAAKVGGIYANNTNRANFIYENLTIQNNLIHGSYKSGVKNLIFFGSSCIYPKNISKPIKEEMLLSGKLEYTNEPYAIAKIAGIKLCENYNKQYKTNYKCLMPCNSYGPNDNYDSKNSHFFAALIKKIYLAKKYKNKYIEIWGTGKPRREIIFVNDIADACIYFMNKKTSKTLINIGTGKDMTIESYAKYLIKFFNTKLTIKKNLQMPDGIKRKLLNINLAKSEGWKAKTKLDEGLKITIKDFIKS